MCDNKGIVEPYNREPTSLSNSIRREELEMAPQVSPERARPSFSKRTTSTPITSTIASHRALTKLGDLAMLTPPSSPPRRVVSSSDLAADFESLENQRPSGDVLRQFSYTPDGIIVCPYQVDLIQDSGNKAYVFGSGAWSTVFKGTCRSKTMQQNGTLSPLSDMSAPLAVAVKSPARRDAVKILRSEAQILSYLRQEDQACRRVACFFGIVDEDSSLVLEAVPLTLEKHIKTCASIDTLPPQMPAVGSTNVWLGLADKLISALSWLHNDAHVVHGDIKPGNIVLKPIHGDGHDEFPYQPLFIDFSSAQRLNSTTVAPNTLSAVTKEYTAPELLKVSVMKDPLACATPESDVFSLGVTLLVAATGDTMVYTGCSAFQRQVLATQGTTILSTVRSLSIRVPRHGIVGRVVEQAFLKKDLGRISAQAWFGLVQATKKETQG